MSNKSNWNNQKDVSQHWCWQKDV